MSKRKPSEEPDGSEPAFGWTHTRFGNGDGESEQSASVRLLERGGETGYRYTRAEPGPRYEGNWLEFRCDNGGTLRILISKCQVEDGHLKFPPFMHSVTVTHVRVLDQQWRPVSAFVTLGDQERPD